MNETELRGLVRQAIALHLDGRAHASAGAASAARPQPHAQAPAGRHFSHALFVLPAAPDGMCVVEPAVGCSHCGFCQSYGH